MYFPLFLGANALCYHPGHEPGIYMNFSGTVDRDGRYPTRTMANAVCEINSPNKLIMECQKNGEWTVVPGINTNFQCG